METRGTLRPVSTYDSRKNVLARNTFRATGTDSSCATCTTMRNILFEESTTRMWCLTYISMTAGMYPTCGKPADTDSSTGYSTPYAAAVGNAAIPPMCGTCFSVRTGHRTPDSCRRADPLMAPAGLSLSKRRWRGVAAPECRYPLNTAPTMHWNPAGSDALFQNDRGTAGSDRSTNTASS